jgi:RNA-dependent RNA polymerase
MGTWPVHRDRMHSQITASDTYDIYYANPDLLTSRPAQPAEYPPGEVWTLNERRGDATVDDICDFIVEFINSDVMVRANSTFVSISN